MLRLIFELAPKSFEINPFSVERLAKMLLARETGQLRGLAF